MMKPTLLAAIAFAAVALAPACASAAATACHLEKGDGYILRLKPAVARQGGTVEVVVETRGGKEDIWGGVAPAGCLENWRSSNPAVGISDEGVLTIAADAKPGETVRITATALGERLSKEFAIIARDAVVLTGTWSEAGDETCPLSDPPMRELVFRDDGTFDATWTPFERYIDYWGKFAFDPATGAITLTPDGGNNVPDDADLEGKAQMLPDGRLKLTGIFFGSPRGRSVAARTDCHIFKK